MQEKKLKINALFQTMYFIYMAEKKRTPLHTMTGLAVHNTCKSSTLIKSLNRTGTSISYDEVQRCRTNLASFTVESGKTNVPMPSHFDHSKFTTAAFHNFDHDEATESGLNGTHDTVAVIFQEKSDILHKKPNISETDVCRSARSFHEELKCQVLKEFYKKPGPILLSNNYLTGMSDPIKPETYFQLTANDLAWFLSRIDISETPQQLNISKKMSRFPHGLPLTHSFLTMSVRNKLLVFYQFYPIL